MDNEFFLSHNSAILLYLLPRVVERSSEPTHHTHWKKNHPLAKTRDPRPARSKSMSLYEDIAPNAKDSLLDPHLHDPPIVSSSTRHAGGYITQLTPVCCTCSCAGTKNRMT